MAKRKAVKKSHKSAKPKANLYAGKTEKDWGVEFGKGIDKGSKSLSEGMEKWGDGFGKHVEGHEKRPKYLCRTWCYSTFGFMGPLIRSIFGIIFLLIAIWFLNLASVASGSIFVSMLSNFLSVNIPWFFMASLLFGYCNYLSIRDQRGYWLIAPIVNSLKIAFVIWILVSIFNLTGIYTNNSLVQEFCSFALISLPALFSILVVLGYLFEIAFKIFMRYRK
jgi:hypothetical protein